MKTRIAIIAARAGALLCGGLLTITATTIALAQNGGQIDALTDGLLGRQPLPSTAKSDKRGATNSDGFKIRENESPLPEGRTKTQGGRIPGEKTFLDGTSSFGVP